MKKTVLTFVLLALVCGLWSFSANGQVDKISVVKVDKGIKLNVNGNDFMINGMNWDYFPIGTNYTYSLWEQPDDMIKEALDYEMSLLKNMGVNTIRQYDGIPPKWIQYIYEKYGIFTVLNHSFGRYGLTLNGVWVPNTEYSDPRTRELLLKQVNEMAEKYKQTPGLLMYLLGNENNYGLFWEGAETENIPLEDRKSTIRAHHLYKLFDEAVVEMKNTDKSHPVAICNGDALFIDIIAKECKDVDIIGLNSYRGKTFTDIFQKTKAVTDKPIMFTEFGADAYNEVKKAEDQKSQAEYDLSNWKEIYENAAGINPTGNCIGGFTFQFSDGWWKYKQNVDLDVHNTNASWSNGGYLYDYVPGENNINEEWFGICAKGETKDRGLYELYPRAAYYALKEAHRLNPYAAGVTLESVDNYFSNIHIEDAVHQAKGDKADLVSEQLKKIQIGIRGELTSYFTGGYLTSTPIYKTPSYTTYPDRQGFDHMESLYLNVHANPADNVHADVSFNILGNVAENPIDEIFYENRALSNVISTNQGNSVDISSAERVQLYRADLTWDEKWFNLNSFYRVGHNSWGYEGDFFGLYPEANYGPNIDIYNGNAPFGFEAEAKESLKGLKIAFGPELWWGANPAFLVKYNRNIANFDITGIYQDDIAKQTSIESSIAVPVPMNRKATIDIKRKIDAFKIELGAIWSGETKIGEPFQIAEGGPGNYTVYQDKIAAKDCWGGKGKITFSYGPLNWYAQGAAMGLVADGGPDWTKTFTGWTLKDCGSGNQYNFLSGLTYGIGDLQIAPNFLWQQPIVGPIPSDVPAPGRPRDILDDPFVVRTNRQTTAGEILFTYDPTPGTWFYEWNNDEREDAKFACSMDFVYRHLPTTQDAAIGFLANRTMFAFTGAPPAHDLWEVNARVVSKLTDDFGFIAKILLGDAQANGSDARIIKRYGGDITLIYKKVKLMTSVKFNDWGPYDYYRDFNLTFPVQLMLDLSVAAAKPRWFYLPETRIGIRGTWRSMDQYSPRYAPTYIMDPTGNMVPAPTAVGYPNGNEWEIRTYLHFNIDK